MNGYLKQSATTVQIKGYPSPRRGKRNLWCPHYGACLDYAVVHNWSAWNCFQCPFKVLEEAPYMGDYPGRGSTVVYELSASLRRRINTDL